MNFLKDIYSEMKTVTYPTGNELFSKSLMIFSVIILSSLFIFGVDTLFTEFVKLLLNI